MPHGSVTNGRRRDQRGAAALEFALINQDTLVNNAAREGAREGSLDPVQAQIVSVVRQNLSQVEAVGTTPSKITVTVACLKPDDTACSNFATDAVSGGTVIVTVALQHGWITPVGSMFGNGIVLKKTVEMRIE
jgi:hypothetical protein